MFREMRLVISRLIVKAKALVDLNCYAVIHTVAAGFVFHLFYDDGIRRHIEGFFNRVYIPFRHYILSPLLKLSIYTAIVSRIF